MSITHLSLFKRSNGFWYIIYDEGGRQRWKSTGVTLKSDALKKLTEFDELLRTKSVTKTLKQFTTEFLSYAKATYAKPTVDIFAIGLRHLLTISGDCLLTQLTPQHIDKYKSERLKAVTATTVNVEIRGLRAVMNIALRWKMVESNPFSGVQLLKVAEQAPTFFSKDDFQKLVSIISEGWLKEMVLLSALTGMRRGETINLRWQDVDLDRKLIHIQSNATFKTKKGKRRTIPISDVAYHLLNMRSKKSTCEYVFSLNEKRVNESFVSHKFKDYIRIAKLNDKLHWHSIRHSFASWLVQDGVSLYEVQRLLGHSDIAVTEVYSHLQPEQLHSTVNRIDIHFN